VSGFTVGTSGSSGDFVEGLELISSKPGFVEGGLLVGKSGGLDDKGFLPADPKFPTSNFGILGRLNFGISIILFSFIFYWHLI